MEVSGAGGAAREVGGAYLKLLRQQVAGVGQQLVQVGLELSGFDGTGGTHRVRGQPQPPPRFKHSPADTTVAATAADTHAQ